MFSFNLLSNEYKLETKIGKDSIQVVSVLEITLRSWHKTHFLMLWEALFRV